jgi:hypothetical protein
MVLKSVTLHLDEEEYKKFRQYLSEFEDPDINADYVLRSYIKDLNRTMPVAVESGWDLKNYLEHLGSWINQFRLIPDQEIVSKRKVNPFLFWKRFSKSEPKRKNTNSAA